MTSQFISYVVIVEHGIGEFNLHYVDYVQTEIFDAYLGALRMLVDVRQYYRENGYIANNYQQERGSIYGRHAMLKMIVSKGEHWYSYTIVQIKRNGNI